MKNLKYRTIQKIRCVLGILCLILLACFAQAVSDRQLTFSAPSGFYEDAFDLTISGGRGVIHYTTDCSEPDENSPVYSGPLHISDRSSEPNVYSAIRDVSPYLNEALLEFGKIDNMGFVPPSSSVDKATVVRAVSIDRYGRRSNELTQVYFVGFGEKKGYEGVNFLSVVTDPKNLFDPDTGIYVCGRGFDNFLRTFAWSADFSFWDHSYNFALRGDESERVVSALFIKPDGTILQEGQFGMRIRGGGSRFCPMKKFALFERESLHQSRIHTEALGIEGDIGSLAVYQGAVSDKLKNSLVAELASDSEVTVRKFSPMYALFLNGEYWGNCFLEERMDAAFFEKKAGVPADEVVIIKNGIVEEGYESDSDLYAELINMASEDLSRPDTFNRFCQLADIESTADYYAVEIYLGNIDWSNNSNSNYALWRSRSKVTQEAGDGRWRWILFDDDYSMRLDQVAVDSLKRAEKMDSLFAALMENETFSELIRQRLLLLAEESFSPDHAKKIIDRYREELTGPMGMEYRRFYDSRTGEEDFQRFCDELQRFFDLRQDYIRTTYGKE